VLSVHLPCTDFPVHRAAVLGSPVAHSLSPVLHRAAHAHLGLAGWTYEVLEVADAVRLGEVLDQGWSGLSLTMPLKRMVLPLLDDVSELAAAVGAVNTVTFAGGRRAGDNTDVGGIATALTEGGVAGLADGDGCVVGGGATAASALAALAVLGDRTPTVVVRDRGRAGELLEAAERLQVAPTVVPWADGATALGRAAAVVSTVPAEASAEVAGLVPSAVAGVLLDVVYAPWPTAAAQAWSRCGGRAVAGSVMLLHQAVEQVRLMTGRTPSSEVLRAALDQALAERSATVTGPAQAEAPGRR
jgi:shikimate dehydrogenase